MIAFFPERPYEYWIHTHQALNCCREFVCHFADVGNAMARYSQKLPDLDNRRLQFVICPYLSSITVHQQLIQPVSSGMDHRESRVVAARWFHQRQADDGPWRCCLLLGAQARLFTNKQCLGGTGPQCSTSYLGKKEGKRKGCEPAKSGTTKDETRRSAVIVGLDIQTLSGGGRLAVDMWNLPLKTQV